MISGELNPKIDLNNHFEDVDNIIATASIYLKNNKDEVINLSNQTLYQLNQLNIDNIKSINELESLTSKLNNINNNIASINSKIMEFDTIYTDSFKQIKLIEESINKQIYNSFSLNIIENNTLTGSNNNNFIKKRIQSFFQNLKSKTAKNLDGESKKSEPFHGITYHYQNNDSPIFLIKKIRINTIKDNEYLESEYITLDKKYRQQFILNFVQNNTNDFKNLKINSKAINANEVSLNIVINEMNLKNRKLIENNDFIFNFESSQSNILEINGVISKNSRVEGNFNLINPTYKVINKTPKQSQISNILTYIQNQDVQFEFLLEGNLNDFDLNITSNVLDIVDQAKNSFMSNKISNINKQKERKINKLKRENNQILDDKVNSLYSNYNASLSSSRFQLNQVLNKQEQIKSEINNKQKSIEKELKVILKTT